MFNKTSSSSFRQKSTIQNNGGFIIGGYQLGDSNLTEPSVLAALRLICSAIGSMPIKIKTREEIPTEITSGRDYKIICRKPNKAQNLSTFLHQLVTHMLLNEETFIIVDSLGKGQKSILNSIEVLDTGRVRTQRLNGITRFTGTDNYNNPINESNVYRIQSPLVINGLGSGVLSNAEQVITLSKSTIKNATEFNQRGPRSPGFIEVSETLTDENFNRLKEQINNQISSTDISILENGMKFNPNTLSLRESEFSDSRVGLVRDISSILGVPLPLLGIPDSSFKSMWEVRSVFMSSCLKPLMMEITNLLEEIYDWKYQITFDTNYFLIPDPESQSKVGEIMFRSGAIDLNEFRQMVGFTPIFEEKIFATDTNNLTLNTRTDVN